MARPDLLKLGSIGQNDYRVLEGRQRIGRIRFASEHRPSIWLWNVRVHMTGGLPMGSSKDIDTAASLALASWPIAVAIRAKHCAQLDHGPIRIYRQTAFGRSFLFATVGGMRGSTEPVTRWHENLIKVIYLIAISFATVGWVWFLIWIVMKVF